MHICDPGSQNLIILTVNFPKLRFIQHLKAEQISFQLMCGLLGFTFMHLADAFIQSDLLFRLYIFFVSMCVPWELNPQPFTLLTQCSTTEPQKHQDLTIFGRDTTI